MKNDYQLDDIDNFRINPHEWLQTLLAIAGDKEKKEEVVQIIAQKTGFPPEKVKVIIAATISVLVSETRSN
jgi:methenyltetrahydromethanopterin cyclohydrolase